MKLGPLRYLVITFPVVAILIIFCANFIDRPLATFGYEHFYTYTKGSVGKLGATLTLYTYCLVLILFGVYFYLKMTQGSSKLLKCISLTSYAFVLGHFAANTLKFAFSRVSPLVKGHLSFTLEKYHGVSFEFFGHGGQSFPSGHMTLYMAFATSVLLYYPRWWPVILVFGLALFFILLLLDLHYLSDLIAGAYLGCTIALGRYYMRKVDPDYAHMPIR